MQKKILMSLLFIQGCNLAAVAETNTHKSAISSDPVTILTGSQSMQHTLLHTQWQLVSYFTSVEMRAALPEHTATMLFSGRRVSGSTGCNQYFSAYQLMEQSGLQFSQSGSTMMACQGDIAEQEQQYLKNLAAIRMYRLEDEQLHLVDVEQQVRMVFKAIPEITLEDNTWQMKGINNGQGGVVSNVYTNQAYLQFTQGKLRGSSGCNTFTASYQIDDHKLNIGPLSSTRKICVEEGIMAQEKQIFEALKRVIRYEIRNNQLRLINTSGSLMISLKQEE